MRVKCLTSNDRDFKVGGTYFIGEFWYLHDWIVAKNLIIYRKWDDPESGIVATFEEW